ncbi:DUF6520 family protein [Aureibaculum sp. 2210JD6-5]|uniref:DUF6520 family protein n=1 Tax=Aureibaculum sp. 2210JD6-5 TaxID=3103957 RepID=UPI002AAE71C2|nr:DUF6520 family protein [Aureibaculum sp. 2210JD6-5]MDY7396859.1 DUF6520 family protein [Aureibaculum sp. 2210JD6-5]
MKTHVFKKALLPILALFMAVGLAFATSSSEKTENAGTIPGYIFQNGICEQVTTCDPSGILDCTYLGQQVYSKINQTTCGQPLKYNPQD